MKTHQFSVISMGESNVPIRKSRIIFTTVRLLRQTIAVTADTRTGSLPSCAISISISGYPGRLLLAQEWPVHTGRTIFAQGMNFLSLPEFRACVARYQGKDKVRGFSCLDRFLCLAFAQCNRVLKRITEFHGL